MPRRRAGELLAGQAHHSPEVPFPKLFDGLRRGVLIAESIQPNKAHIGGRGINMLTGAEAVAPVGGAAFHDNKVWVKKAAPAA